MDDGRQPRGDIGFAQSGSMATAGAAETGHSLRTQWVGRQITKADLRSFYLLFTCDSCVVVEIVKLHAFDVRLPDLSLHSDNELEAQYACLSWVGVWGKAKLNLWSFTIGERYWFRKASGLRSTNEEMACKVM